MLLQKEVKSDQAFLQPSKKCLLQRKLNSIKHFYSDEKCCLTMKMYEKTTCHNQFKFIHAQHLQIYKNNTFLQAYL